MRSPTNAVLLAACFAHGLLLWVCGATSRADPPASTLSPGVLDASLDRLAGAAANSHHATLVFADSKYRIEDVRLAEGVFRLLNKQEPVPLGPNLGTLQPEQLAPMLIAQSSCAVDQPLAFGGMCSYMQKELGALAFLPSEDEARVSSSPAESNGDNVVGALLDAGHAAGCLSRAIITLRPERRVDGVEVDREVVSLVKRFYRGTSPDAHARFDKVRVPTGDGVDYVKRIVEANKHYAAIFLDAYSGPKIPRAFLDAKFLTHTLPKAVDPSFGFVALNYCLARMCLLKNPPLEQVRQLLLRGFAEVLTLSEGDGGSAVLIAFVNPNGLMHMGLSARATQQQVVQYIAKWWESRCSSVPEACALSSMMLNMLNGLDSITLQKSDVDAHTLR